MVAAYGGYAMMPTKSFSTFPQDAPLVAVPSGARVKDVADACRSAALAFAWNARLWTKRDLATWLVGPYARAALPARADAPPASCVRGASPIAEATISGIVDGAHATVLEDLRRAWSWRYDAGFARDLVEAGLVARIVDEEGASGYAPVDARELRLLDRVRSLFFADYLTRPYDWASFAVCAGCGAATFEHATHERECGGARISLRARVTEAPADDEIEVVFADEPELEVMGEIEIEVDTFGVDEEDVDAFDDLRDTIVDPLELAGSF